MPDSYTFQNAHGETIELPGTTTIEDLVELGVTRVGFKRPDEPIEPDEWRATGSVENSCI